jgi:hypothetical protein
MPRDGSLTPRGLIGSTLLAASVMVFASVIVFPPRAVQRSPIS